MSARTFTTTRALAAAILAAGALPAAASCNWEWLCNGDGNCKIMPICSSVYEIPPPAPNSQPPAMPQQRPGVAPIPTNDRQ